jgi:hypothetical protein
MSAPASFSIRPNSAIESTLADVGAAVTQVY